MEQAKHSSQPPSAPVLDVGLTISSQHLHLLSHLPKHPADIFFVPLLSCYAFLVSALMPQYHPSVLTLMGGADLDVRSPCGPVNI